MKKTFQILTIAAMALALASCSKDGHSEVSKYITVEASVGTMTRATTVGDKTTFDDGDAISVYAWIGSESEIPASLVVNNSLNTKKGATWTAAPQMLWDDMTTPHYFLSVYPAHRVTNFKADPVMLDVSDQEASDLLYALNLDGLTAQKNPVPLTFSHAMAKLHVNLFFRNQWGAAPTAADVAVALHGHVEGTIDYLTGTITGTKEGAAVLNNIPDVADNYDLAYSSVVLPTECREISVTVHGAEYVFTHPAAIPLDPGKCTVINLNIGRNEITLDGVSIRDWQPNVEENGEILNPREP